MDEEMMLEHIQNNLNQMNEGVATAIKFMQFYTVFLVCLTLVFVISLVCICKFGAAKNAPSFGHTEPLCHLCSLLLLLGALISIILYALTQSMVGTAFLLIWSPFIICATLIAVFARTYCIKD